MFKNLLTTALRNFIRQKGFSLLNIVGLSIGLAVSMLVLIKVTSELGYDRFHRDIDHIYRIVSDISNGGQEIKVTMSPAVIATELRKEYPEILDFARTNTSVGMQPVRAGDRVFDEARVLYADSTFFRFFSFELLEGQADQVLKTSGSVVVSGTWAKKLFGSISPVGQTIKIGTREPKIVTGVFRDCPSNSTIKADFMLSIADYPQQSNLTNWLNFDLNNYVKLQPGANVDSVNSHIKALVARNVPIGEFSNAGIYFDFRLQPMREIHLYSDRLGDEGSGGVGYIFLYLSIALVVLSLAIINFINLTTAKSLVRAKEVAVRKVIGSERKYLIMQFLGESMLLALGAFVVALVLVEVFLPWFASITGAPLEFGMLKNVSLSLAFLLLALVTGFVSGIYPALVLSKFSPMLVLKQFGEKGRGSRVLRNSLIVFQFAATITLIICTFTIYHQLKYIQDKKMGFERDNLIVLPLHSLASNIDRKIFKEEIKAIPDVVSASLSESALVDGLSARDFVVGGEPADKPLMLPFMYADLDIVSTANLKVIEGRGFSYEFPSDNKAVLINQAFVKRFGWKEPLTMTITFDSVEHNVIGVVEDFNFESLRLEVKPMIIIPRKDSENYLLVRVHDGNSRDAIGRINAVWKKLGNEYNPKVSFIDELIDYAYKTEQSMAKGFLFLTIVAIVIACLGLVGLAAYFSERRSKEMGIRKVMGGSSMQLVMSLSRIFLILIAVSNIVAVPVSVYAMREWLSHFAYRTTLSWGLIALAITGSFALALLSISALTFKAASKNPVESLKYE
jgi:putative ABC transport system permease protein